VRMSRLDAIDVKPPAAASLSELEVTSAFPARSLTLSTACAVGASTACLLQVNSALLALLGMQGRPRHRAHPIGDRSTAADAGVRCRAAEPTQSHRPVVSPTAAASPSPLVEVLGCGARKLLRRDRVDWRDLILQVQRTSRAASCRAERASHRIPRRLPRLRIVPRFHHKLYRALDEARWTRRVVRLRSTRL